MLHTRTPGSFSAELLSSQKYMMLRQLVGSATRKLSSCRLRSRDVKGGSKGVKGKRHCYSKPQRYMVCQDGLLWPVEAFQVRPYVLPKALGPPNPHPPFPVRAPADAAEIHGGYCPGDGVPEQSAVSPQGFGSSELHVSLLSSVLAWQGEYQWKPCGFVALRMSTQLGFP